MPVPYLFPFFLFLCGLLVGSFANVCIYRLPRGQSIIWPPSHCPSCQAPVKPYDNIPLLSFLLLRGRCRACRHPISWRYPLVEALNALLYLLVYSYYGFHLLTGIYALLLTILLIVTFIDLEHKIIPDRITLSGLLAGLLLNPLLPVSFFDALLGGLIGGGIFLLVALLSRGGMGGGDIKLMAMLGVFLGWQRALLTIFLGVSSGALVGIVLMLLRKKGRKDQVPFGPFLALGGMVALFWGEAIIAWYLSLHA
ncbi:MAG: prepilin peptidase [Nitrospinota bacterium]|nr:MAG: prepilin peptidase [Nitrospinota bacterium]